MTIPQNYTILVGTKQSFSRGLFSAAKDLPEREYDVLDVRFGSATIVDLKTLKELHPTIQFKLKGDKMKRAQWSRPFACREIKLKN